MTYDPLRLHLGRAFLVIYRVATNTSHQWRGFRRNTVGGKRIGWSFCAAGWCVSWGRNT